MKDLGFPKRNPDEVQIDLHMFCALVLNRVGREVHCADIIAVHHRGTPRWAVEFLQELPHPTRFCNTVRNRLVFCFGARARDGSLPFR
jgi:hypothetical protein